MLYTPRAIVESTVSYIDIQNQMAESHSKTIKDSDHDPAFAKANDSIHTFDGRHRSATDLFFDGSFGRRILVCFLYSAIIQVPQQYPLSTITLDRPLRPTPCHW